MNPETLSLAFPAALLLPALLFLLRFFRRERSGAAPIPSIIRWREERPSLRVILRRPVLFGLSAITLCALGVAAARPQKLSEIEEELERKNIVLCLDISKSMSTMDFSAGYSRASRLEALKSVVAEFIKERTNDRVGLVVFGSGAFLQAPLTTDHRMVLEMLESLDVGLAGDGTAIGDGLALSLKRLEAVPGDTRAVVLATDGVNNSGRVNPVQAAKIARSLGIKVHVVGIGTPMNRHPGSRREGDFDEEILKLLASLSGGVYLNAQDPSGLRKVYQEINVLEGTSGDEPRREMVDERFLPYLLTAFTAYALYVILSRSTFLKVP